MSPALLELQSIIGIEDVEQRRDALLLWRRRWVEFLSCGSVITRQTIEMGGATQIAEFHRLEIGAKIGREIVNTEGLAEKRVGPARVGDPDSDEHTVFAVHVLRASPKP